MVTDITFVQSHSFTNH